MAEEVEFLLKLQDQMTASLRSGAENALKMSDALDKLIHKLEGVEKEEKREKEEEEGMFTRAVEKGEIFKDILEKVVEKVFDLTKEFAESTIEITDFGEKAEIALRHLNGNTEEAEQRTTHFLAEAKRFANDAALPVESVTQAFLELRKAGIDDAWARPLTAAASDLAGLSGHPENFRQLSDAFARMGEKGEVTARDLMQLRAAGLNVSILAKELGAKDFVELQKHLEKKPLGLYEGLRAIEDVIKETAHEDYLGEVTKQQGETFGGTITRLKNAWVELIDGFNENPLFKELRADFSVLADDILANLPTWEKQFATAFDPLLKALDDFIKNPDAIKNAFESALNAAQAIGSVAASIVSVIEFVSGHQDVLKTAGLAAGGAVVAGSGGAIGGALLGADIAYGKARGQNVSEIEGHGYSERDALRLTGKFADGGPVGETGPALVHEGEYVIPVGGAPVLRGGGGGGGGGAVHAPITINVHVEGGGAGLTEEGLSLKLAEILPGALVSPFEKLAATVGAT